MGNVKSCCLSLCPPNKDEEDEYGERARILNDPTDGTASEENYHNGLCSTDQIYGSMEDGSRNEPNNNWNRTLHKMAVNLIDVSTTYVSCLEPNEVQERQKLYQSKLSQLKPCFLLRSRQNRNKRLQTRKNDNIDYRKLQHLTPVNDDDRQLIANFANKISDAFYTSYLIELDEELVVQFDP